jgi:D-glycero-alpha-D-manno-heptose-7-phosphate kinase
VSTISEILHPAIREVLRSLGFDDTSGIEVQHQGDLPARSGIGSSSTFTVGLIKALLALRGQIISKHELALKAIELEQNVMRECVGSQDQVAAAYGGFNIVRFERSVDIIVEPLSIPSSRLQELESRLLLFYTGVSRLASDVAKEFVEGMREKRDRLLAMRRLVERGVSLLAGAKNLDEFGRLLNEGWLLKREITSRVTNDVVDGNYKKALDSGALGGKLLGAGTSGFMVFYVPLDRQADVIAALSHCLHVPFSFERGGSTLLYHNV